MMMVLVLRTPDRWVPNHRTFSICDTREGWAPYGASPKGVVRGHREAMSPDPSANALLGR